MRCSNGNRIAASSGTTSRRASRCRSSGFVESFNGRLRDECLNEHLFTSYRHAREIISAWQEDYNQHRPHTSLDGLTPSEYAIRGKGRPLREQS